MKLTQEQVESLSKCLVENDDPYTEVERATMEVRYARIITEWLNEKNVPQARGLIGECGRVKCPDCGSTQTAYDRTAGVHDCEECDFSWEEK